MPEIIVHPRRDTRRELYYGLCAAVVTVALMLAALAPSVAVAQESGTSGMPGLIFQQTGGKTAYACIFVGVGPSSEGAEHSGVSGLLARVILHSQDRDGVSPVLAVERLGGRLDVELTDGYTCFTLLAPKKSIAKALRAVASALISPELTETALRQERRLAEGRRDAALDNPVEGAYRRFLIETYPDAPYSFLPDGDFDTVSRLGLGELKDWHGKYYTTCSTLSGGMSPANETSMLPCV